MSQRLDFRLWRFHFDFHISITLHEFRFGIGAFYRSPKDDATMLRAIYGKYFPSRTDPAKGKPEL